MGVVALGLSIAALAYALIRLWRREEAVGLEVAVLIATTVLVMVGVAATLLAMLDALVPLALAGVVAAVALATMPWRVRPSVARAPIDARRFLLVTGLLLGAAVLRWPPIDHALAGRDQGSYVLRAESTARTGGFRIVDTVVRDATADLDRPGSADIAGLYPRRGEGWRDDVYEAGYRPGWYLADRERGLVVPQFLHLHPTLSTVALWLGGTAGPGALVVLEGVLAVAGVLVLAQRLLPAGPWAALAAAAFALSPLGVWVHRNTLTEALTGLLTLCAAISCTRARESPAHGGLVAAAMFLGATAWVRGNAWITAPVVLATLWLLPPGATRHRATAIYVAVLGGAVIVHAITVFPYLHDELVRQFTAWTEPSPIALIGVFGIGLVAWWSVDEIVFGIRSRHGAVIAARVRPLLPWLLAAGMVLALAAWAVRAATTEGAPWSRLDALVPGIGVALLVPAAIGIAFAVPRWAKHTATPADVWLCAVAAVVVVTTWTYAGRNLPKLGLYYYGRYLVPELLPLAAIASAYALARLHALAGARQGARAVVAIGVVQLGIIAWPFVVTPATRLQEFAGAGRIVDALAERVPADAIVVAGGEGWHHGHTFNQVAGALAMRYGRRVVPYHSREAAYATLHELLVTGPAARGEPAPRVFLLINEATHALGAPVRGQPIAALDDGLPPPFLATSVALLELVTDRLTPTTSEVPIAVTRDALRMGLVEVVVDPASDGVTRAVLGEAMPPGVENLDDGSGCLDPEQPLELRVSAALASRTAAVVVVAAPGHAATIDGWRIAIDDEPRRARGPGSSPRSRDTLGPFAVSRPPRTIAIRGATKPARDARCPHGELHEVRLLGPEEHALASIDPETLVFAPAGDLGHAITPVAWVSGRGLSRLRPQAGDATAVKANSLVLTSSTPLQLAPEPNLVGVHDVVVNITGASVGANARIRVWADDVLLGELDPPDARDRSWQSPALEYDATGPVTRWRLVLVDTGDDDVLQPEIWVRDIGLFSRTE